MNNKNLIAVSLIFLFTISAVSAVQYGMMGDNGQFTAVNNGGMGGMMGMMQMMSGGYGSYNGGTVLLSWITYLLTITLMIAGIYWLIKTANRK